MGIRLTQARKPDSIDDQKTGVEVGGALAGSNNLAQFLDHLLSQVKRIIHGDRAGAWTTDVSDIDGEDLSLQGLAEAIASVPGTPLSDDAPEDVGSTDAGASAAASRSDHVHAHGDQAGGTLHALAEASGAAGFMSGADKAKLDGIGTAGVFPIREETADYALTSTDYTLLMDATSGPLTATLPDVAANAGRVFNVKKIDASTNVVTIDGDGATIDDAATLPLDGQYQSYSVQSDGTRWHIL